VLQHEHLASPGKHGWQLHYYDVAAAVIEETSARWRHDQPWLFTGRHYEVGSDVIEGVGLKLGAVFDQKDPRRCGKVLEETVTTMLKVAPKGAQADKLFWDAQPMLSCLNGTLDLTNPQQPVFMDHQWNPDHHLTWMIQAEWDATAYCPDVLQFLSSSIPDPNQREMFLELSGDAFMKWDQSLQSYGFLVGSGSNGKGLALGVLRALGGEAISSIGLSDLANHKFAAADLINATINLVGDESSDILRDTSRLKQYTGGDAATIEAKFKDIYSAVPKVKFLFAVNQLPRITDFSIGFFRRPKIVEFPRTFAKDPNLEHALSTPDALRYWLYLFVEAYGRLKARGDYQSQYTRSSLNAWREQNDVVSAAVAEGFLELCPDSSIHQDTFVAGIKIFADLIGMKPPRLAELVERLNALAAWNALGDGRQPIKIAVIRPDRQPRQISGLHWGPAILTTQYRPNSMSEMQTVAEWIGVSKTEVDTYPG
jgi:P4 family phage/plasmid primase-like protien